MELNNDALARASGQR